MSLFSSLFGDGGGILTVVLALGIVIVLIVLGVWLLKVLFRATGNVGRTKFRRLHIVDTLAIDPKRQLILIRRDDVEHLIMVGGTTDHVLETGIEPPPQPMRRPRPRPGQSAAADTDAEAPAEFVRNVEPQENLRRQVRSLRHTGLLRGGPRTEPTLNPQPFGPAGGNDAAAGGDLARTSRAKATPARSDPAQNDQTGPDEDSVGHEPDDQEKRQKS